MDICVTTPKNRMADAAAEAEAIKQDGGGEYFRRFPLNCSPSIRIGDRVFYVMDGFIRGYALVSRLSRIPHEMQCDTTGRWYEPGIYVFMDATTWKWIEPVAMTGFQGFQYFEPEFSPRIVGGWLDPMPAPPCPQCGGEGVEDTGGQNPDGSWVNIPCGVCGGAGTMP